jgi:uncharacterized protein (TIGR02611 family)
VHAESGRRPEGRERLRQAALEAERATGEKERTEAEARRHIIARLAIIAAGVVVTVVGLAAIPLPGPGLVLLFVGLGILAQEVPWAERLLVYARRKTRVDQVKAQPRWVKVVLAAGSVLGLAASAAYTVSRL